MYICLDASYSRSRDKYLSFRIYDSLDGTIEEVKADELNRCSGFRIFGLDYDKVKNSFVLTKDETKDCYKALTDSKVVVYMTDVYRSDVGEYIVVHPDLRVCYVAMNSQTGFIRQQFNINTNALYRNARARLYHCLLSVSTGKRFLNVKMDEYLG